MVDDSEVVDSSPGKSNVIVILISLVLIHSNVRLCAESFALSVGPPIASMRRHLKFL